MAEKRIKQDRVIPPRISFQHVNQLKCLKRGNRRFIVKKHEYLGSPIWLCVPNAVVISAFRRCWCTTHAERITVKSIVVGKCRYLLAKYKSNVPKK